MRKAELEEILEPIQRNQRVQMMKQFVQHGKTSTFQHCRSVAETCDRLNERFRLGADRRALITAAMLHDFYLYDWHSEDEGMHNLHGFTHAETACINAQKYFNIDTKTSQVIYCHMWPLNPRRVPKSKEGWIVCFADKCISLYETLFMR